MNVLIIDNDLLFLDLVSQIVQRHGASVTTADSCTSAFAALAAGTRFDLVLTDVDLGSRCSGVDVAARMRLENPNGCVILMSGRKPDDLRAMIPEGDSYPILPKPFRINDLNTAIAAACPALGVAAQEMNSVAI